MSDNRILPPRSASVNLFPPSARLGADASPRRWTQHDPAPPGPGLPHSSGVSGPGQGRFVTDAS